LNQLIQNLSEMIRQVFLLPAKGCDYNTHLKKEKGGFSGLGKILRRVFREIFPFSENLRVFRSGDEG